MANDYEDSRYWSGAIEAQLEAAKSYGQANDSAAQLALLERARVNADRTRDTPIWLRADVAHGDW